MRAFLLIAAIFTAAAQAAIVNVQRVSVSNCVTGTANTITSTGANHLLVVTWSGNLQGTVTSITGGGTWLQVSTAYALDSVSEGATDIWYVKSSTSGATSFTVNYATSASAGCQFWEFSGTDLGSVDQVNHLNSQGSTTSPSGPAVTTGTSGEIIITALATGGSVSALAGGFTLRLTDVIGSGHGDDLTTTSGTFTPAWTTSAGTWAASAASFKPAAAATAGTRFPLFGVGP